MLNAFKIMTYAYLASPSRPAPAFPKAHNLEMDQQANIQRRGWEPTNSSRTMAYTHRLCQTQQDNVWLQTGATVVVPDFRVNSEMQVSLWPDVFGC